MRDWGLILVLTAPPLALAGFLLLLIGAPEALSIGMLALGLAGVLVMVGLEVFSWLREGLLLLARLRQRA